jgi:lipopolysaccharide transport system ATP-binding protein
MKPAIEIQRLGKKYSLTASEPYQSLRDVIAGKARMLLKSKKQAKDFWALQDINLSVFPGDRLGIIGRNGAGKSTLLKILSRITAPTTGEATLRGRVGSLLEVGTGFHPELTGRENIFFNGSVLGLKRKEIKSRLDAIVDFSGVERFIDMPLKTYSSGMQMRLAFAVASHLDTEILLIDEVLAVGDMEFQKKCIGKMDEVSRNNGKTILFVSHNLAYINGLCNRGILLDEGRIKINSTPPEAAAAYMNIQKQRSETITNTAGNESFVLRKVFIIGDDHIRREVFPVDMKLGIEMHYSVKRKDQVLWLGHQIYNEAGVNVFDTHSVDSSYYKVPHEIGDYKAIVWVPANLLNTGNYYIHSAIFNHKQHVIHVFEKDTAIFTIAESFTSPGARGDSPGDFPGIIRPLLHWDIEKINDV